MPTAAAREEPRWRALLIVLVAPCLLLGPGLLRGERFLPHLPVGIEPLASENPEEAARAMEGCNFGPGDRIFPTLSDQVVMREELARFDLPTWEPDLGLGAPLFANSIAGVAYPPNWLGLLLPPDAAAGPLAFLTLVLAGLGVWLFLGRLGLPDSARAVGALGVQLGGFGVANLFYFMKVDAALWLPWSLWAVEGLARGERRSGLWLSLSIAFSFLAGFPPIAVFGLATTVLYALVRLRPGAGDVAPIGRLARAGIFVALGLGAASWQLLPTVEASRQSVRQENSVENLDEQSLPATTLLGVVAPELVAAPTDPPGAFGPPAAWWLTPAGGWEKAAQANALEWNTFAGVALALLAVPALLGATRRALFPALLLVGVYGFAQGWPGIRWLYALPGLNAGAPNRALAVAWILWPWLAALGVKALLERRRLAIGSLAAASFVAAAAAFVAWTGIEPEGWARDLETTLLERYADHENAPSLADVRTVVPPPAAEATAHRLVASAAQVFASAIAILAAAILTLVLGRARDSFPTGPPAWKTWNGLLLVLVLALAPVASRGFSTEHGVPAAALALAGVAAVLALSWRRARAAELAVWLPLALVLVVEGAHTSRGHLRGRALGESGLFPASEAIEAVREAAGDGRVVRLDPTVGGLGDVESLARPNLLQVYGIADVTPWTVFTPRALVELFGALDADAPWRSGIARLSRPAYLDAPLLDLLRVTAVLSRQPLEHERLTPVLERDGFHVYRREGAHPPARVVAEAVPATTEEAAIGLLMASTIDTARQTLIVAEVGKLPQPAPGAGGGAVESVARPAKNRFDVRVAGGTGGWLVMHEQYYPGWKATVNGEDARIYRADHVYRAVLIPPGDVLVRTWYEPWSLRIGFALTLISLAGAILLSWRR